MAKVILTPIGSAVLKDNIFLDNQAQINLKEAVLEQKRLKIKQGWGEKYQARVHAKNKLTSWERLELLGQEIYPIGTFVQSGGEDKEAPAAGVITAFIKIENRWCMVIANDNTVASGSWWPKTPEKIIRAQEIALKLKLPVVYLVDCSGLYLPEQAKTFPGQKGAGHIFKMNSLLSNAGVPQIAGVFGDCIAGGGYMPIISDKVYMTEQAYMVIAGAALIQGAKNQNLSSLDIGGPSVHVHLSNCADFRVPDDETCLLRIRQEISLCSSSAINYYRNNTEASKPSFDIEELSGVLSDIKQVIARLVDDSLFWELFSNTGHEVITGIAKISGLYVGIAANVQGLLPHPQNPEQKRPGGILYKEGVAKLATFSRACDADGIPLIWLQDVSGFDVGLEAEKQGLLGYGSSLIYANSTNQIPLITILLRKASGAGYYAMSGLPYDPVIQLSTCLTRLAVMEGKTLALGAFNTHPGELEKMRILADKIEADMDPFKAAGQMDTDEIVKLSELRSYLECLTECSYQAQNHRRIKNPRIWSLHDLVALEPKVTLAPVIKTSPLTPLQNLEKGEIIKAPLDGLFY
ncbi:MAG: carboxyl transferase domain-containing protein, partial [Myxococcaceae bacterium]